MVVALRATLLADCFRCWAQDVAAFAAADQIPAIVVPHRAALADRALVVLLEDRDEVGESRLLFLPSPALVAVEVVLEVFQVGVPGGETFPELGHAVQRLRNLVGLHLSFLKEGNSRLVDREPVAGDALRDRVALGVDGDPDVDRRGEFPSKSLAGRRSLSREVFVLIPIGILIASFTLSIIEFFISSFSHAA
jgi:hypothetical protein